MSHRKEPPYLYVYAAVRRPPSERLLSRLPRLPDAARPRALAIDRDVSLIVADVSPATYNATALEARLADLDWVSKTGAAHHAVSDKLARSHAVVPFRLFTLFSSEKKAVATLNRSKARLVRALQRLEGKREWVLRIGAPDPSRLPKARTPSAATSGTGFLRQKADARRERIERTARVRERATKLFDTLQDAAADATARTIEPGMNLLLDAAFLVDTRQTVRFRKTLNDAVRGLLDEGCPVSLTGPWPAYSFAAVD